MAEMLCENCGTQPARTYRRTVNGREVTLHLCPSCYAMLYPEREKEGGLFPSLVGGATSDDAACPVCGTTLGEFRRVGLLGCAACYRAFRNEILFTVRGIQGKVRHVGKRPEARPEEDYDRIRSYVVRVEQLRAGLEEAMRRGDYEEARRLERDLRELTARERTR